MMGNNEPAAAVRGNYGGPPGTEQALDSFMEQDSPRGFGGAARLLDLF